MEMLITGGTLIDGTGAGPVPNPGVRIDGDSITAVGADAPTTASVDAVHIDATGRTVLPGLIDAHCHSTFDDVQSNDELFFHRDHTLHALVTGQNLTKIRRAGVTSIVDPDSIFSMGPSLRQAVDAGVVEGPRMAAGVQALMTAVGGTAGRLVPDEGQAGYAQIVNSVDEVIMWTRRHIKQGADWIKIHATGLIPGRPGELLVWSFDELKAACDAAHELGIPVMAHCRTAHSTRVAAQAGCDMILHASFMDEAALEAVVEAGASLCPTFTFLANLADFGHKVGTRPGMEDIFRDEIEATGKMMRTAYDAGVPLICGSESGFSLTPYGHWHGREMEVFTQALGLSPIEAITCATRNGAIAMRMEGEIGTIEKGMKADVIVVDGDPVADIRVLNDRHRMAEVICRGERTDLSGPWPVHGPLRGEKVGNWSEQILTTEIAYS